MSDKKDRIHEETQEDQSRAQDSAQNKAQDEIQDGAQDGVHGISNPYGYIGRKILQSVSIWTTSVASSWAS